MVTHKVFLVESVRQSANLNAEQEIRQAYTASWQGVILLYVQLSLLAQVTIKNLTQIRGNVNLSGACVAKKKCL